MAQCDLQHPALSVQRDGQRGDALLGGARRRGDSGDIGADDPARAPASRLWRSVPAPRCSHARRMWGGRGDHDGGAVVRSTCRLALLAAVACVAEEGAGAGVASMTADVTGGGAMGAGVAAAARLAWLTCWRGPGEPAPGGAGDGLGDGKTGHNAVAGRGGQGTARNPPHSSAVSAIMCTASAALARPRGAGHHGGANRAYRGAGSGRNAF
jgi:hypothetical protein